MTETMTAGETSMISPARVLERVLDDVLCDESKWTQGAAARDVAGHTMSGENRDAVRFCIMGAIRRAVIDEYEWYSTDAAFWDAVLGTCNRVNDAIGGDDWPGTRIAFFNDSPSTTFEDVRLVLKRAAAE